MHDPVTQLGFLRQCLSSDKKPLGLFLGAGCPLAIRVGEGPLIPDIAGMTEVIRKEIEGHERLAPLLAKIDGHFTADLRPSRTIEDILTHVRALRAVAGGEEARGLSASNLDELDRHICDAIHRLANKNLPEEATAYHSVASWIEATVRTSPVEVFTTNYDLLMEQAFEDRRVPYFDGFAGARRPLFDIRAMEDDKLPPRWARLWKLHGSINWYQTDGKKKAVYRGTADEVGAKRVIHPSHLKYQESRRMPYLAMADRLKAFLRQPSATLILCGYSFRDEHVNEVIIQGLELSPTAVAFAMLFGSIGEYEAATAVARQCSNINLLAQDGAVIGGHSTSWIERESQSIPEGTDSWLRWDPATAEPGASTKKAARLLLGDFKRLGDFLSSLVGSFGPEGEGTHAA